jgi:hypothetical protein
MRPQPDERVIRIDDDLGVCDRVSGVGRYAHGCYHRRNHERGTLLRPSAKGRVERASDHGPIVRPQQEKVTSFDRLEVRGGG